MKLQPTITDDDIEALLSGTLSPGRRRVVEDHLASHPDQQARVAALRADQEALRALGAELLDEPVPARFLRLLAGDGGGDGEDDDTDGMATAGSRSALAEDLPRRRRLGT